MKPGQKVDNFTGLTVREIAAEMDTSYQNVIRILRKAEKKFYKRHLLMFGKPDFNYLTDRERFENMNIKGNGLSILGDNDGSIT